eukprot:TRINITY_DN5843_c0_g1_i3.p1 TRINITY_DN5843_c0_g1~~TRINITY_DN5843_c0_g1_i3.p1  ORF type:complete len:126 (-),score=20.01 TRINITY_DN5843_c0_g1_i3:23-400(-)
MEAVVSTQSTGLKNLGDPTYISFNQDCSCFSVGTSVGFFVCESCPYRIRFKREFEDGGIGTVEMLHQSNILVLIGGGPAPKFPKNTVQKSEVFLLFPSLFNRSSGCYLGRLSISFHRRTLVQQRS